MYQNNNYYKIGDKMRKDNKSKKVLNVPHLRFNDEEWAYKALGNIASKFDYGLNAEAIDFDGKHKYIRITDIDENSSKFKCDDITTPSIYDSKYRVENNDILLARTGASTGKAYLYDLNDGELYFAGFLIRININRGINSVFIFNQLKTLRYKKWVKIVSNRSGQPGINAEEYKTYTLAICSKNTQDKIADFLTLIDKRIETQMKIIEEYRSLIKGIRECVFNNYSGKSIKLCEVLNEYCEKNTKNNLIPIAVGKYGIRQRSEIYTKELSKDLNKNKVVTKNTLIIGMGTKQIDIGILFDDISYCVSPAYTTYKIANINAFYLNELLIKNNPLLSKKYMIISARQGKSVNKKELLQHTLVVHNAQDQIKIVTLFQHLYKSLKEKEKLLDCFQKEKIYLLNNLFI